MLQNGEEPTPGGKPQPRWSPAEIMAAAALAVAVVGSLAGLVVALTFSKEPSSDQISAAVKAYCEGSEKPCRSVMPGPALEFPRGLIAAFSESCPSEGWDPVLDAEGRLYAVSCGTRQPHLTAAAALNG